LGLLAEFGLAKIRLVSPQALYSKIKDYSGEEGSMEYNIGEWGHIDYGQKYMIEVRLFRNLKGCQPSEGVQNEKEDNKIAYLVERGECTFALKSVNVGLGGGDLAMIYNNSPFDKIGNVIPIYDKKNKSPITPMVLINYVDGKLMRETLESGQKVMLTVNYDAAVKVDVPEVRLWMSPHSQESYILLGEFQEYYNRLHSDMHFKPSYRFRSHSDFVSLEPTDVNDPKAHCYSNGSYCALPADAINGKPLELIDESLRQACLFEVD
jgi:hypothetical protein